MHDCDIDHPVFSFFSKLRSLCTSGIATGNKWKSTESSLTGHTSLWSRKKGLCVSGGNVLRMLLFLSHETDKLGRNSSRQYFRAGMEHISGANKIYFWKYRVQILIQKHREKPEKGEL